MLRIDCRKSLSERAAVVGEEGAEARKGDGGLGDGIPTVEGGEGEGASGLVQVELGGE